MSKLSFRPRALDASKPMPIYMAEELPDLPDYTAINRAVPQMPSGMKKEEECEHHLQRAICAGLIIPTPEVSDIPDKDVLDKLYPANYKQPRQLIHMQPFTMEQDIPDYDMDSEDERWLDMQAKKLDLTPLKFEEMMDRLEKSSGQTVVTLQEAKALLKEDDDLIIAIFDYWLNKRLKLQHPLILAVKTEQRTGTAPNDPYLAFRRRTEKMQTRKHRKNDEASYEKMLKLRRDLSRAVTLLELVKRREKMKREFVHLTVEVFEKRYHAKDYAGAIAAEVMALKRPAFTPIFHNDYANHSWSNKTILKDDNDVPRKERRPYKKRKHKSMGHNRINAASGGGLDGGHVNSGGGGGGGVGSGVSPMSDDEQIATATSPEPDDMDEEGQFAFRRNKLCSYHMPLPNEGNWPWCGEEENGYADKRYRYTLTSLAHPKRRCIGFARRRLGRGGRVILDRLDNTDDQNDFWKHMDYTIYDSKTTDHTTAASTIERGEEEEEGVVVQMEVEAEAEAEAEANRKTDINLKNDQLRTCNLINNNNNNNNNSVVNTNNVSGSEGDNKQDLVLLEAVQRRRQQQQNDEVDGQQQQQVDDNWLHFRPRTPPADYTPPCDMLEAENYFIPNDNSCNIMHPFAFELRTIDDDCDLFTDKTFITTPFLFDDDNMMMQHHHSTAGTTPTTTTDVPVTDTRQQQQQQHSASGVDVPNNNTIISNCDVVMSSKEEDGGVVCCSKFSVRDDNNGGGVGERMMMMKTSGSSGESVVMNNNSSPPNHKKQCIMPSLKLLNNNAELPHQQQQQQQQQQNVRPTKTFNLVSMSNCVSAAANVGGLGVDATIASSSPPSLCNSNGITQFGIDGKMKNNNAIQYPYTTTRINAVAVAAATAAAAAAAAAASSTQCLTTASTTTTNSSGFGGLHSSTHPVTLNHSHSANILEIPLTTNDADDLTNAKVVVNADVGGVGGTTTTTSTSSTSSSPNNKPKTIVRKNNLVMEVT